MSEPTVDVVAVLGDYATICAHKEAEARWNRCEAAAALWSADHASAREAIAAVAELIEADQALDVANDRLNKSADCNDAVVRIGLYEQYVAAYARRAAALAQVSQP